MQWLLRAGIVGALALGPSPCPARAQPPPSPPAPSATARQAPPSPPAPSATARQAAPDLARLKTAYEQDRTSVKAAMDFAAAAIRANQPELARPVLYSLLEHPAALAPAVAAEAWFQMGHVHLRAQEYEEALACWTTVLRDFRTSDRASGSIVNAASLLLQVQGQPDQALAVLTAGRKDGSIKGPHIELANFLLFQIHVDRHAYTEARGLMGSLPDRGERHDLVKDTIPVVLWKTGDETKARSLLTSRFEDASADASALNNLASTLLDHEVAPDLAVAAAARAIVLSSGSRHDIWDTYAEALFRSGDVAKAIGAEEKAVSLATAQKDQAAYKAQLDRFKTAATKKS